MRLRLLQKGESIFDGQYKIGDLLGHGAFGQVYFCTDTKSGMQRVCKVEPTDDTDPHIPLMMEMALIYELRGKCQVPTAYFYAPWVC